MNLMQDLAYHRAREIQELAYAGSSRDASVKSAHLRLAAMHAGKAQQTLLLRESASDYWIPPYGKSV